jgi:hypothetical protein
MESLERPAAINHDYCSSYWQRHIYEVLRASATLVGGGNMQYVQQRLECPSFRPFHMAFDMPCLDHILPHGVRYYTTRYIPRGDVVQPRSEL